MISKKAKRRREYLGNWLFILPYMSLFMVWIILPAIAGLVISLTKWNIFTGEVRFVGLNNYLRISDDDLFWRSIGNTFRYAISMVILGNLASFTLASGLATRLRGHKIFQTTFFAPVILSIGVIGITWGWLYNSDFGILNSWLQQLGLHKINWLTNPKWAMPSVVMMVIWAGVGFNMMIYLAGLLNVPSSIYEAAAIDGASGFRRMWYITLPMLKHTFAFTFVISTIGALQVFDQPYILTGGGPDYATYTFVYHIYSNGFRYFRMGYASALSYILALIIFFFAIIQYKLFTSRRVEY